MAKIIVTGASGMVGTNLCKRLVELGHEVYGFARTNRNQIAGVSYRYFDLLDKETTKQFIEEIKPDYIYHTAAQPAEARGQISPIDMTERNVNIFLHVLVPSINIKVKRFFYMSSVSIYGDAETPYTEDQIPQPKNIYGVNKQACEQILKILGRINNLEYTIFRPHNMYGEYQDMRNPYKNVVALFMRRAMEGGEVTIYGEGKMRRAFSYVGDVIDVLVDALKSDYINQTINVGSSLEYSIEQLLKKIEEISGKKITVINLPARPGEVYLFISNNRKMRLLYPYKETSLDEGLLRTWEWLNLPPIMNENNEISKGGDV